MLVKGDLQRSGDGVLSGVLISREEDGETLLEAWWVRLAKDLDDFWVGEPLRDLSTSAQAVTELSAGDVQSAGALSNLIDWLVLVGVWEVGHHLERHDLNTEFLAVLFNGVLSIVWTIELLPLAVFSWSGVITSDNEMSGSVVLADDSVPDGLTWSTHAHGEWEETKDGHAVWISWEESLVDANTSEVVNVSWLGKANDWVNQDVGQVRPGSSYGQLSVGAVHGVSGLESNDAVPSQLVEVKSELGWGVW